MTVKTKFKKIFFYKNKNYYNKKQFKKVNKINKIKTLMQKLNKVFNL